MQNGVRVDRALAELFPDQSRSFLTRLIESGLVQIDGVPAPKASHRVRTGETVEIELPEPTQATVAPQNLPVAILHDDADIVVIDKPAGLVVHPAAGHADGTLVNALLFHISDLSGIGGELRPGIVHRLDKDTSGVMVIAKHDEAHRKLTRAWNSDAVRKEYIALIYGSPRAERGTIDAPIGRDPRDRKRMAIVASGRRAITEYELVERLPHVSLVSCRLRTGRTHQIRVHMKHLGHPIVGDRVYAGPQWRGIPDKRLQRALSSLDRQALHAVRIAFPHPRSGAIVSFESPVPADIRSAAAVLGSTVLTM